MITTKGKDKFSDPRKGFTPYIRWVLLVGVTVLFTIILYPNLVIRTHSYQLGDVAEKNIKAAKDFFVEDKQATELNRKRAAEEVLTVYDHDTGLASRLSQNIQEAFKEVRVLFDSEIEKPRIQDPLSIAHGPLQPTRTPPQEKEPDDDEEEAILKQVWQKKSEFEEKLGIGLDNNAYKILINEKFSSAIADQIVQILSSILENGVVSNKELLLKEAEKGIILRTLATKTEAVVQGLRRFYGLDQAKTMARILGDAPLKGMNHHLVNLIVDIVQRLIQPNITLNMSETLEDKKRAALEITPTLYRIKKGEMLLREGEIVTEVQLLKLKAMENNKKTEQALARSAGFALLILCMLSMTYLLFLKGSEEKPKDSDKNLIFIASILVAVFLLAKVSAEISETFSQNTTFTAFPSSIALGLPIASGAMVLCLFLGLEIAIPFAAVIAVITGIIFNNRLEVFIYYLITGMMAAYWIQKCRERKVFITAGVKLGLLGTMLATTINIYAGEFSGFQIIWDMAFAFLGGIVSGIITAGIAPLVEMAFGFTTDITLLELANLDQPILRKLMMEAPGTYHHSVIVGSLVEAAAAQINANPLLAKVCGYYHDIGKIKQPLYFIENQADGVNRHDRLEPSMSSLILIAHIKQGVETAKSHKLGQVIIDTIRQHHGTSLISYFYDKAKQRKGEDAVNIDDFRYPGPKPQTREAGLVMLADVVEAASRTLENPTPARIQSLVKNLINKVFSDGQLDNCELTLKDLHKIADSFNTILYGIHHHRIEYAETVTLINGKRKDGRADQQQSIQVFDFKDKSSKNRGGPVKGAGSS